MAFFSGALLAAGVLPAAIAAPAVATGTLAGPASRPCDGPRGTDPVGTAVIQSAKSKAGVAADQRALRVGVAADNVPAGMTYNVVLATTVTTANGGIITIGCQVWSVGTTAATRNGKLSFAGTVTVPRNLSSFEVFVSPPGPTDLGYTTDPIGVAGL